MSVISVIVGSVRQNRFAERPAQWIFGLLKARKGVQAELLDLKDFPMPFFDAAVTPAWPGRPPYEHPVVKQWTAAIAKSDGFIFVAPEYNHGYSAVLKNAIDWVYPDWNRKAACFVSYGSVMGARSVEQLRQVAVELQLAPIRASVHIPVPTLMAYFQGKPELIDAGIKELDPVGNAMLDDLLWWTEALKKARTAP